MRPGRPELHLFSCSSTRWMEEWISVRHAGGAAGTRPAARGEPDRQDQGDSVERFVGDLRRRRDDLEVPPTWDAMVHRAKTRGVRVSKSTLHKVAKLEGLPSELAVRGYLTALSQDPAEVERWVARRTALVALPGEQDAAEFTTRLPGRTRWRWWVAIVATLLITNVMTGFVVHRISTPEPQPQQNSALAATGDNPLARRAWPTRRSRRVRTRTRSSCWRSCSRSNAGPRGPGSLAQTTARWATTSRSSSTAGLTPMGIPVRKPWSPM